jgi:hypothetical protein
MENTAQEVEVFYDPAKDDKTPLWLKITVIIATIVGVYIAITAF